MPTYLLLGKYTDQGIKTIKETTERGERFKEIAKDFGVKVREILWLMGEYDVMNIVEAEDDQSVAALLYKAGSWGYVRTTTLRAFTYEEMNSIFAKMD